MDIPTQISSQSRGRKRRGSSGHGPKNSGHYSSSSFSSSSYRQLSLLLLIIFSNLTSHIIQGQTICTSNARCVGDSALDSPQGLSLQECQDYCLGDASCYFYTYCATDQTCIGYPSLGAATNGSGCASVCMTSSCNVYYSDADPQAINCVNNGIGSFNWEACEVATSSSPTGAPSPVPITNTPSLIPSKSPTPGPTSPETPQPSMRPTAIGETYQPTPSPTMKQGAMCINNVKCSGEGGFDPFSGYTLEQCQEYCFNDPTCYFYSFCPGNGYCQGYPAFSPPVEGSGCASVCTLGGCAVYSAQYNTTTVNCTTDGVGLFNSGVCGTFQPSAHPSVEPTPLPTLPATSPPSQQPSKSPSLLPTPGPSPDPTLRPTATGETYAPSPHPTRSQGTLCRERAKCSGEGALFTTTFALLVECQEFCLLTADCYFYSYCQAADAGAEGRCIGYPSYGVPVQGSGCASVCDDATCNVYFTNEDSNIISCSNNGIGTYDSGICETMNPSSAPTYQPSGMPTKLATSMPSSTPTRLPSQLPTQTPTLAMTSPPTATGQTYAPTAITKAPSHQPTSIGGSLCIANRICTGDGALASFLGYTLLQCQEYCINDDNSCYFYTFCPITGFCQGYPAYGIPVEGSGCASVCVDGGCSVYSTDYNVTEANCQSNGIGQFDSAICPTVEPSMQPTQMGQTYQPTPLPTSRPTTETLSPTELPTAKPTLVPTSATNLPTQVPSQQPSTLPSLRPTSTPSATPTTLPTQVPTQRPSTPPSVRPTVQPSANPTKLPTVRPSSTTTTSAPTNAGATGSPTRRPSVQPSTRPTNAGATTTPSKRPTAKPSTRPTNAGATGSPTRRPSSEPSRSTTPAEPTRSPTVKPSSSSTTPAPTNGATPAPTNGATPAPTNTAATPQPTGSNTPSPTGATPQPTASNTPSPTDIPLTPAPTSSPEPTPSPTPAPTSTLSPTPAPTVPPFDPKFNSSIQPWADVAISGDGQVVIAGVTGGYLFTSYDKGNTWIKQLGSGSRNWTNVAIASSNPTKMAAVVYNGPVFLSPDGGVTWLEATNAGIRRWTTIDASTDFRQLVAAHEDGDIFISYDSGVTWSNSGPPPTAGGGNRTWSRVSSAYNGKRIFALAVDGSIYVSYDGGVTWSAQEPFPGTKSWASVTTSGDGSQAVAVAYNDYIYTYQDSAAPVGRRLQSLDSLAKHPHRALQVLPNGTWTLQNPQAGPQNYSCSGASADLNIIIVGTYGGPIFYSLDSGSTWIQDSLTPKGNWSAIAISDDGTVGALVDSGGYIWVYNVEIPPTPQPSRQPTAVGETYQPTVRPTLSPSSLPSVRPSRSPTETGQTFSPTPAPTPSPTAEGQTPAPTSPCLPIYIKKASKAKHTVGAGKSFSVSYTVYNSGRFSARNVGFQVHLSKGIQYGKSIVFPPIKSADKRGGGSRPEISRDANDGSTFITWEPFTMNRKRSKVFTLKLKTIQCPETLDGEIQAMVYQLPIEDDPSIKSCVKQANDISVHIKTTAKSKRKCQ